MFEYSNIFVTLWTRLAPVPCFYNLNSILDHCYQQNIHEQSVISMEIKQKTLLESENGFEQIFEYICIKILLRTNIRIYSYPKSWHERISEYIRIQKMIRTNIRINIRIKNIRIFEYSNIFMLHCKQVGNRKIMWCNWDPS